MNADPSIALQQTDINESTTSRENPDVRSKINLSAVFTYLNVFIIAAIIYIGWQIRNEYFINADHGFGYALGICGGVMMLLLLIYPLKKRFSQSRIFIFSTPAWFRIHMMLGILGPLAILFHCNFSLGSTNSNVALLAMFLMVSSGLFGRYLYSRIHMGIYGKKAELSELLSASLEAQDHLTSLNQHTPLQIPEKIIQKIKEFETEAISISQNNHPLNIVSLAVQSRFAFHSAKKELRKIQLENTTFLRLNKNERTHHIRTVESQIFHAFNIIRKISGLNFYERLFSLWHMMHMPIFFMLIASAFIHVYAVHAY